MYARDIQRRKVRGEILPLTTSLRTMLEPSSLQPSSMQSIDLSMLANPVMTKLTVPFVSSRAAVMASSKAIMLHAPGEQLVCVTLCCTT
jgi:hypothetical protein